MDRNGFQSVTLPASAVHLTWPNAADATHSAEMAHGVARTNTLSNCGGGPGGFGRGRSPAFMDGRSCERLPASLPSERQ